MKLMKVDVPVVTDETCRIEYPFMIADSMLCAGEHGTVHRAEYPAPVSCHLCQARTAARETPAAPWSATTLTAPTTSEVNCYSPTLL